MTKDEILHALVMVARGFPNHPEVQTFSEKLAELFAGWVAPAKQLDSMVERITPANVHPEVEAPKRRKKAE